jgi:predicted dehydrogenase
MKPFRVGFVGAGAIAGVHLDAVTKLTCRPGRRHRSHPSRAQRSQPAPAGSRFLTSRPWSPPASTWSTSSPRPTHAQVALQAIELGCHVLVEKPLATSDADCARPPPRRR